MKRKTDGINRECEIGDWIIVVLFFIICAMITVISCYLFYCLAQIEIYKTNTSEIEQRIEKLEQWQEEFGDLVRFKPHELPSPTVLYE